MSFPPWLGRNMWIIDLIEVLAILAGATAVVGYGVIFIHNFIPPF